MVQTLKEYLTEPYSATDWSTRLDEVTTISEFRKELPDVKVQTSFASSYPTKKLGLKPRGYITLNSIFDPKSCYDEEGHPEEFVDDLDAFLKKYGNWEVTNIDGDNTYNYNSPVDDYIGLNQVTIVNTDVNYFESKDLLFMSIGTSLDPRGNYTKAVIAIFDNDLDDHYNATVYLTLRFNLIYGSFIYDDIKYTFGIDGQMGSEYVELNIQPEDGERPDELDDIFETYCNTADEESFSEEITKTMNDAFGKDLKIENLEYEFCSDMED